MHPNFFDPDYEDAHRRAWGRRLSGLLGDAHLSIDEMVSEELAVLRAVRLAERVKREVAAATAAPAPCTSPMTRAALVRAHEHEWPTIERDLRDAGRNRLAAAKAGRRGWNEPLAMEWARANGKLKDNASPAAALVESSRRMASLPSKKHTLRG